MSSVQSVILGMLEKSSLPGLYKGILRNLIPNMSRVQQEEILVILHKEKTEKSSLGTKMDGTYWKYSHALDRLEKNPSEFDEQLSPILKARDKEAEEKTVKKSTSTKQLSNLKSKLALKQLKKKLK